MAMSEQIDLNAMASGLDPALLAEVADFIGYLIAKQARSLPPLLRQASLDDEPFTLDDRQAVDEAIQSIAQEGLVTHAQLKAELGL